MVVVLRGPHHCGMSAGVGEGFEHQVSRRVELAADHRLDIADGLDRERVG